MMNSTHHAIGLPNIMVTAAREIGDDQLELDARSIEPEFPSCCDEPDLVTDGWADRKIADTEHDGRSCKILYRVRKVKCRSCEQRGIRKVLTGPSLARSPFTG